MPPQKQDLSGSWAIQQGDDYEFPIRLKDSTGAYINLTGWAVKSQIRTSYNDPEVLVEFTATADPDQGTNTGLAVLSLTNAQTALLEPTTTAVWDLQTTDTNGKIKTWMGGKVTITAEVTRP